MSIQPKRSFLLLATLAIIPQLPAQTTTPVRASDPSGPKADEETIVLSPFEVTGAQDHGYQATQTLAGTRIRTDLKDVSASITVVTEQFLNDIGATDSSTLLQYTTNTDVAGTRGTFGGVGNGQSVSEQGLLINPSSGQRVRGLAAADNARNYFISDIPWDSYDIDRVEILRGPNSLLYGLGSPGGIIDNTTKTAEFRNFDSATVRVGSYGSVRSNLDLNQQLIDHVLSIRIAALWNNQKYEQKPAFQDDKRIYGSVRFDPDLFRRQDFHTDIKVNFENGNIKADRPREIPPQDGITPWFRSPTISADNPYGGMGKTLVNNPYDALRTDNVVAGDGRGLTQLGTANYQPWLADFPNQQQPYWLIDGATNQTYAVNGGYINNGAIDKNGTFTGVSGGILGRSNNGMFYGLNSLPSYVLNTNLSNPTLYTDAKYGQYRNQSLTDPSVFDFYHTLIDGPTKSEFEKWNAYNLDFSQTGWDDRVGFDVTYDRQRYRRGGEALLGYQPTLTIDVLKNFPDYYLKSSDGVTQTTNQNVGRPYVTGAGGSGGSSYYSDRQTVRGSIFTELRATDFTNSQFLIKLLGKQRFNGVAAEDKYYNENRAWQLYANSQSWAGYWNNNDGSSSSITDRPPLAFIYLGPSVLNRASAAGADIPGITNNVTVNNSGVYVFDSTWKNTVSPNTPWSIPSNLSRIYNPATPPKTNADGQYDQWYQNSNPANYTGWNSNFQDQLLRYADGQDDSLLTKAQKSLRVTNSYSGSWQGYFWKEALVATFGWRYDQVKTKDVTAKNQPLDRNILNVQPGVYELPDQFPTSQIFKGHSTSGGLVAHLNNFVPHDPLPFDFSVGYNESSNFQVTSVRRDVYGTPIGNPSGKTREYSATISTKNGKLSLKVVKFTTKAFNTDSTLANAGTLGSVVSQGLRWRNVFLYQLGGYDFASRNQSSYRNTWTNAYPAESAAQAQKEEDAAITAWNNIQTHLAATGFFPAWNFSPTTPAVLVDRTTYLTNPTAYAPDPASVSAYTAATPQGFSVTADTMSKGYELELTAQPLENWRLQFNASDTTATQQNVGGASLSDYVSYINSQLINPDGTPTPAGMLPQYGGASASIYNAIWSPWLAGYTLLKLQQGSSMPEIRKWHYNVVTNYDFTKGFVKGAGVGAAYRWEDRDAIGYPILASTGTVAQYDLGHPYWGPKEGYLDLWVSYGHKLTHKIDWKIQLNVYNVGKQDKLIPISVEPDGKTWASAKIAPVQEWQLSNTFTF